MPDIEIVFTPEPNLDELLAELAEPMVDELSDRVLIEARRDAPVDTGELRNSGEKDVVMENGVPVAVVTFTADHALVVEVGSNDTPPQPYLRPALRRVVR